jgi:CRP/FNR family transcriptional regulator
MRKSLLAEKNANYEESKIVCLQKVFTFWDKLNHEEKQLLYDNTISVNYEKDALVAGSGKECVGVLVVRSGGLRVYMLSEDGREITLYRLRPGDVCILSASCLLSSITFDVAIEAETASKVYQVNITAYSHLQSRNIYVENYSLRLASEKFSDVMWAMEQILFMSFDRRLASFLFDEFIKTTSEEIQLTHEQIAKYIGSAREVVSRMLKRFESEGIVRLYRGGVQITDLSKLKRLL